MSARAGSRTRWGLLLGLVFLLLAGLYTFMVVFSELGLAWKDDALFLVPGKSFAEGTGYRFIDDPAAPPARHFPFFYSFLLSFVWAVAPDFPANLGYFQLTSTVAGLGFLWLTYCYLVRFGLATRGMALATVILTGFNPIFVLMSGIVQSEMVYSLVTIGALYCLGRWQAAPRGGGLGFGLAATGLLAVAPVTRYVGVALDAAAGWTLLRAREYRRLAVVAAGIVLVLGPWALWVYANRATGYAQFFTVTPGHLLMHAVTKLSNIAQYAIPYYLIPHLESPSIPLPLALAVRLSVPVLCLVGIVGWMRTSQRVLVWYILGYILIFLGLDGETIGERHLLPISPFLALGLLQGVDCTARRVAGLRRAGRLDPQARYAAVGAMAAVAFLSVLARDARFLYNAYAYQHVRGIEAAETERSCLAIIDWVKTNLPREAVVASGVPAFVYLYAGRHVIPVNPFLDTRTVTPEKVERVLRERRAEYFVDFHRGWGGGVTTEYVHSSPQSFVLLYSPGRCGDVFRVRDLGHGQDAPGEAPGRVSGTPR